MNKAILRIIDANLNRAGEGLRVAEEFCRFALNNKALSSRCKQMRHRLSSAAKKFDPLQLVTARDTENDIGCGMQVTSQMKRTGLEDCLTAGFARTTQALRVLSETCAASNTKLSETFEQIRYDCYSLQKDIALLSSPTLKFAKVRLYGILTASDCSDVLSVANQCAIGGADCLQLRIQDVSDYKFFELAQNFVKICRQHNVISIINDRADIAIASDADGLHLGQDDMPIQQVRACQLKPLIIGTSTHSMEELQKAVEDSPCYVGTGSVFNTNTKDNVEICGLDYITAAANFLEDKPTKAVAIGGINLSNIEKVMQAGATKIAVSSCICKADNPAEVCRKLKQIINKNKPL